jgi:hypothetical protein
MQGGGVMSKKMEVHPDLERAAENARVMEATRLLEAARIVEAARVAKQIEEVHARVFNGLPMEIRKEVKDEIGKVNRLIVSILLAMFLALAGIVVEGRVSSSQASAENAKNYRAIIDIGAKLDKHVEQTK